MLKLKTITQYCRARGFAMALDDITLPAGLPSLLQDIRPAFVKLDGRLGAAMLDVKKRAPVLDIIRIAHATGASVLAEGVESEALYRAYHDAGVDMFQGYYIAEPERYPPVGKKRKSA
jgi:EAL domain-containing protein (putative c-di-GMP-specific phosphodiesterase class I)